jgi:hypothetical protein|tara:strand:+ start:30 stop:716 length:687 start_codon:yes stop_codon:yes gene_type:complete
MKKYFIDEAKTFAINTPVDARVELMGWEEIPIVYIDNFYKNPNMVRNLAIKSPPTSDPRILGGVTGSRVASFFDFQHIYPVWVEIAQGVFGLKKEEEDKFEASMFSTPFSVNVTQSKDRPDLPHIDLPDITSRGWAGLIYLNKGDECKGGTGFYTYKGHQVNPKQDGLWDKDYVCDSIGPWELMHLAEMKFNRMIMYPATVMHTPYDKPGFFEGDDYRLVQVFFLPVI